MFTDLFKTPVEQRAEWLKEIWLSKKGYPLDLEHPKTFTEKIQWYKTYYMTPDLPRIVDKISFKDWIAEHVKSDHSLTAKTLRVFNSPEEVDLSNLPKKYVVKSNCRDYGRWVKIVRDADTCDVAALENEIKADWFDVQQTLVNSFCHAYHTVKPRVFVEEFMEQGDGDDMLDYKLFCFSGEPEFFYVIDEGKSKPAPLALFDPQWNAMKVHYIGNAYLGLVDRPKQLDEMLDIAKQASSGFPFVRIDFCISQGELKLTEMTFYPTGGWMRFDPASYDEYLGSKFILPTDK